MAAQPQHERLDVLVVGAGRVGTALAAALLRTGAAVGLVSRSDESRARALTHVPDAVLSTLDTDAEVVLLCVADDDLESVAGGFAGTTARLVAHTSGRHGLGVLHAVAAPVAALHPAMTFTGGVHDVDRLPGITFAVTAGDDALAAVSALVARLGGVLALVPEAMRSTYHAGMSHAANHLVTLLADAADLLRRAGLDNPAAALGPITSAALANALAEGDAALTGPVVRGDIGTIAAHLHALRGLPVEDSYRAMATRTVQRSRASGRLRPAVADPMLSLLTEGG